MPTVVEPPTTECGIQDLAWYVGRVSGLDSLVLLPYEGLSTNPNSNLETVDE